MNKFKIVKMKSLKKEYERYNLSLNELGLIIDQTSELATVLFFNRLNLGDYALTEIFLKDLIEVGAELPEEFAIEVEGYIKDNLDKIKKKTRLDNIDFKEFDCVELIVSKEKYIEQGIKKGDTGIIASDKIVKNSVLVDFSSSNTQKFLDCISVDIQDLKKIKE